jgi:hypothetical protein
MYTYFNFFRLHFLGDTSAYSILMTSSYLPKLGDCDGSNTDSLAGTDEP